MTVTWVRNRQSFLPGGVPCLVACHTPIWALLEVPPWRRLPDHRCSRHWSLQARRNLWFHRWWRAATLQVPIVVLWICRPLHDDSLELIWNLFPPSFLESLQIELFVIELFQDSEERSSDVLPPKSACVPDSARSKRHKERDRCARCVRIAVRSDPDTAESFHPSPKGSVDPPHSSFSSTSSSSSGS